MSYVGPPEASAILRGASDVEELAVGTSLARFVAPGSLTAGRYGLFRWDMAPRGGGPSAHIHRTFSEAFYVLAGTVRLFDGRDWVDGGPGDFLYVPEGGIHAFRNESHAPASMLILFAPGTPREAYFQELAEILASGRVLSDAERDDLLARHDQFDAT